MDTREREQCMSPRRKCSAWQYKGKGRWLRFMDTTRRYVRASGMELNDIQEQWKCRKDYPSRICAAKVSKVGKT